jgi:hypothetical protein
MKKESLLSNMLLKVFILLLATGTYSELNSQAHPEYKNLKIKATGTGRTTGHVLDITYINPTENEVNIEAGPCYIPSSGQYQPYIVPTLGNITVPPQGQVTGPVWGYCTDIHMPPVPAGESAISFDKWIFPGSLAPDWKPAAENGWLPTEDRTVTIPGKDVPLGYTIDAGKNPREAAPVLAEAINRISQAYDRLREEGNITTPFSGNPEKERESVIQQTFWIFTSGLSGNIYRVEDFAGKTADQYETSSGKEFATLPADEQDKLADGIAQFWDTFEAVGAEAKVLTSGSSPELFSNTKTKVKDALLAPDYSKVKKADDFDKIRRTKYDKYVVEREINKKTHEEACEEIDIDPDSDFAKACKRVYGK